MTLGEVASKDEEVPCTLRLNAEAEAATEDAKLSNC